MSEQRDWMSQSGDVLDRSLSRRGLLARAALMGIAAPAAFSLLAACGGDDDDDSDSGDDTSPTWGGMVASGRDYIITGQWWIYTFPGIAIMLTVLAINDVGDWLRDFLDPRLRL